MFHPADKCLVYQFVHDKHFASKSPISVELYSSFELIAPFLHNFDIPIDYLSCFELFTQNTKNQKTTFCLIHEGGKPVLFTFFQTVLIDYQNFNNSKSVGLRNKIIRFILQIKQIKTLFLGSIFRSGKSAFFVPNGLQLSESQVINYLHKAVQKMNQKECFNFVVLKELPFSSQGIAQLQSLGYNTGWSDIQMQMDIHPSWNSFGDYQSQLSRKYLARSKKIRNKLNEITFTNLSSASITYYESEIYQLYQQVIQNQPFVAGTLSVTYFADLKLKLGNQFEFVLLSIDDKPVGFYSAFVQPYEYEVYYIGLDYRINQNMYLYFNILFSTLERAIILQKSKLLLGRTSLDAKASMGAQGILYPSVYQSITIPHKLVEHALKYFIQTSSDEWKNRNPFKSNIEIAEKDLEAIV
ncbi:MAG: hypothetical protein SFY32_08720 [Bacteroidota bacterium]|nr:hypothetical protein [Bacteroidota bacterium]